MQSPARWLPIFEEFISELRISSKEINSDDDRGVPLVLWDSQRRFLKELAAALESGQRSVLYLKSRQLGVTTVSLAIDLFWLAMHKNMTCALVTENDKNRDKNRAILRQYMESFPAAFFGESFQITKGGDNRHHMKFSNGSRIDFLVAGTKKKSTAWGEGEGYAFVHLTEVASYGDEDGLKSFEEAFAQTNPDRLFIYESTAKGFNYWADKWRAARQGSLTERAVFIGWWASNTNKIPKSDPRFALYGHYSANRTENDKIAAVAQLYGHKITPEQMAWIRWREAEEEKRGSDRQMLDQNQPWTEHDAFIQSGFSFFPVRQITKDIKAMDEAPPGSVEVGGFAYKGYRYYTEGTFFDMKMQPETEDQSAVELRVWEEPVESGEYVIGCDPAWGRNDHKDRHAIEVFRCYADKIVQVAEYASADVEVTHCAWVLAHLAGAYGDCVLNYEVNGPGNVIKMEWDHIRALMNAQMNERIVKEREWTEALSNARWYLYARPDSSARPSAIGFSSNFNNKGTLMHGFKGSYAMGDLVIRSRLLYQEMINVQVTGSNIGAPESRSADGKDDRVFASAFAHRAWIEWKRPKLLTEGATFEVISREESKSPDINTRLGKHVRAQVMEFFQTQQERANRPPQNWKDQYGIG